MPNGQGQDPPVAPSRPPVGAGPGVLLTREAAERTRAVVRFVESVFLSSSVQRAREPRGAIIPGRWVRLTATSIAARSGSQCYSGAITFQGVSETGVLSDSSETGTGWNGSTKIYAGGAAKYYWASWSNGKWWLWPSSCADLS